jgi:hypothetical protein
VVALLFDLVGAASCFVCLSSIVVRKVNLLTINARHIACQFCAMP